MKINPTQPKKMVNEDYKELTLIDQYKRLVNRYYMKQNNNCFNLLRIEFNAGNSNLFLTKPRLVFYFSKKGELSNFQYQHEIALESLRSFITEQLTKYKLDYTLMSRKTLKILLVRYIRKYVWKTIVNQIVKKITDKSIAEQNINNSINSHLNLIGYYKNNTKQCNDYFNQIHGEFCDKTIKYYNNDVKLKHFKIAFDKQLSNSERFQSFKQYMKEMK